LLLLKKKKIIIKIKIINNTQHKQHQEWHLNQAQDVTQGRRRYLMRTRVHDVVHSNTNACEREKKKKKKKKKKKNGKFEKINLIIIINKMRKK